MAIKALHWWSSSFWTAVYCKGSTSSS